MAVDYDLVVVGNNAAARIAAMAAKQRSARVALIAIAPEVIPSHTLLSRWAQIWRPQFPIPWTDWARAMTAKLLDSRSSGKLASLGIEQIDGVAQFSQKPQLQVQVQNRVLRSHRYLLCLDTDPSPPNIPGLLAEHCLMPADLLSCLDNPEQSLPNPIIIFGDGPAPVILSQALARLGHAVSLISNHNHILPWEDAEAAVRVQAHLEADGVKIYTGCTVAEVKTQGNQTHQVITNLGSWTAKTLIWAKEPYSAHLNPNLVTVNLRHTSQGLWVNPQLRTSQAQIYACGSVLGGYTLPDIAHYEATVAVKNLLSGPNQRIDYRTLPWSIQTLPELARVGWTEAQAHSTSSPIHILRQSYKDTEKGQISDQMSGWCKIIVRNDGQILGAHVVGIAAAEIIHLISIAIRQQSPISKLADSATFTSSYGSIVGQAAQQWRRQ